jgi:Protein of unknown function (DUF3631)
MNDRAADNWRPLLAIADLAGGEWPKQAREAACALSGDGHEAISDIELLRDIRTAFGDSDVITSADLVAALTADPERPWATWGKGDKPLSQNALARLLKPFSVVSETVHPLGRSHAKGYKRVHFEAVWEGYLSGQNTSSDSKACKRANTDEMGITCDFQIVQKTSPHALENANLSYSHACLHVSTVGKPESAAESDSATNGRDPGPIPEFLLRRPIAGNGSLPAVGPAPTPTPTPPPPAPLPLCDHCGTPGNLNPWDWPGRPDGLVLYSSCEGPWFDSEGGRQ